MTVNGWTTWGRIDFDSNPMRVYKHFTGPIVALPASYPDPFILLSQMNEYLEAMAETKEEST